MEMPTLDIMKAATGPTCQKQHLLLVSKAHVEREPTSRVVYVGYKHVFA